MQSHRTNTEGKKQGAPIIELPYSLAQKMTSPKWEKEGYNVRLIKKVKLKYGCTEPVLRERSTLRFPLQLP